MTKAEGVGIEPTGDSTTAPRTALKAGTATRRHPLPGESIQHTSRRRNPSGDYHSPSIMYVGINRAALLVLDERAAAAPRQL